MTQTLTVTVTVTTTVVNQRESSDKPATRKKEI